ncbi:helix-turn-helix domain-containing protein [Streptomyces sp. NPDC088353]|uniref:helix-turn-helix domain-containing protein n=1 Tax=Streptomyces sp. NPDC088353 TaxID=3365855 RepID=UPI003826411E
MHQPPTYEVDGEAIRDERMEAGLTQEELARQVGISRRYVSHLEKGSRRHMKPKTYRRLREALNVTDSRLRPPCPTEGDPPERK